MCQFAEQQKTTADAIRANSSAPALHYCPQPYLLIIVAHLADDGIAGLQVCHAAVSVGAPDQLNVLAKILFKRALSALDEAGAAGAKH